MNSAKYLWYGKVSCLSWLIIGISNIEYSEDSLSLHLYNYIVMQHTIQTLAAIVGRAVVDVSWICIHAFLANQKLTKPNHFLHRFSLSFDSFITYYLSVVGQM